MYLAAVLEYLTAEMLEQAGLLARREGAKNNKYKTMVTPRHIVLAVGKDTELSQLCKDTVMTGGGRLPAVATQLSRLKVEMEGEVEQVEQEGEQSTKEKDPMFGKWIQKQNSLQMSMEESFSEHVLEYGHEAENERKYCKESKVKIPVVRNFSSSSSEGKFGGKKNSRDFKENRRLNIFGTDRVASAGNNVELFTTSKYASL